MRLFAVLVLAALGEGEPPELLQELALQEVAYLQEPLELQVGAELHYAHAAHWRGGGVALGLELGLAEWAQVAVEVPAATGMQDDHPLHGVGRPSGALQIALHRRPSWLLGTALEIAGPSLSDVDEESWSAELTVVATGGRTLGWSAALGLEASQELGEAAIDWEPTLGLAAFYRFGVLVPVLELAGELDDEGPVVQVAPGVRVHPGGDLELGASCAVGLTEIARGFTLIVLASTEHELGPED